MQNLKNKKFRRISWLMFKAIHYCEQMYLRPLEICDLKYKSFILQKFFQLLDLHGKQLKKTKVRLDLLTNTDTLLMVQKGIRGGICHSIYQLAKANNKYIKIRIKIKDCHIFNIVM